MKVSAIFLLFLLLLLCLSCVSKERESELLSRISELETQIDECENGADKLVAVIKKAYADKNYSLALKSIQGLHDRHPESPQNVEFAKLTKIIEKKVLEIKRKEEAEERERVRLANLNNTGIWEVTYYVDDFGEPTKQSYIRNTYFLRGTFSNTATQNSALNVRFLISNSSDISIMLYEYANNNPVKAYSPDSYSVLIQDNDGKRYRLTAVNSSDRLSFDKAVSRTVHSILMKGGNIKFRITEVETPTTQYEFTIQNADYYKNAYRKLR